jgi:AcrR family transcriptional regulator
MAGTRDRIVAATIELFRRRGYHGTGLKDVTQSAGATTGSLYHFFPGGKTSLAEAVLLESGSAYEQLFELIADENTDTATAVAAFFDGAAEALVLDDYVDICPIGMVAGEVASTEEVLREAAGTVFAGWTEAVARRLRAEGVAAAEADELAGTIVAALQGAFLLARVRRDPRPLHAAGRHLSSLVAACVARVEREPSRA